MIPTKVFSLRTFPEQLTALLCTLCATVVTDQQTPTKGSCQKGTGDDGREQKVLCQIKDQVASISITEFVTGFLHGAGEDISKETYGGLISKRIADDMLLTGSPESDWAYSEQPGCSNVWRRSPIWLVIRVSLQINLLQSPHAEHHESNMHWDYKVLILYILTTLLGVGAKLEKFANSTERLHHMAQKVTHRAEKLERIAKLNGFTIPYAFLNIVSETVREAMGVLEKRFKLLQKQVRTISWPPEAELEVWEDTNLKMPNSKEYIKNVLSEWDGVKCSGSASGSFIPSESPEIFRDTRAMFTWAENYTGPASPWSTRPSLELRYIEIRVEKALDEFVSDNIRRRREEACCELYRLLSSYNHFNAGSRGDVGNSINFLTSSKYFVYPSGFVTVILSAET